MAWQPLHVRLGTGEEALYEGIPAHLRAPLWHWVSEGLHGSYDFPEQARLQ